MQTTYAIGPSIGIARLGDSEDGFYLAPDAIGALPITCDNYGNIVMKMASRNASPPSKTRPVRYYGRGRCSAFSELMTPIPTARS